jgi:hypothetical protein
MFNLYEQIGILVVFMIGVLILPSLFLKFFRKLQTKGVVVHFFEPPKDISILEVGYFFDSKMHFRDVLAWFIDIKNRGFVSFRKEGKDVKIVVLKEFKSDLEIENEFWKLIIRADSEISLKHVLQNYNTLLLPLTFKFLENLRRKSYLKDKKSGGVLVGTSFGLLSFVLGGLFLSEINLFLLFLGIGVWGGFCTWSTWMSPSMTEKGTELYKKLLGFGDYLKIAEKDREKFKQSLETRKAKLESEISGVSNLEFSQFLPYMMILNVDKGWYETLVPELRDFVKGDGEIVSRY